MDFAPLCLWIHIQHIYIYAVYTNSRHPGFIWNILVLGWNEIFTYKRKHREEFLDRQQCLVAVVYIIPVAICHS